MVGILQGRCKHAEYKCSPRPRRSRYPGKRETYFDDDVKERLETRNAEVRLVDVQPLVELLAGRVVAEVRFAELGSSLPAVASAGSGGTIVGQQVERYWGIERAVLVGAGVAAGVAVARGERVVPVVPVVPAVPAAVLAAVLVVVPAVPAAAVRVVAAELDAEIAARVAAAARRPSVPGRTDELEYLPLAAPYFAAALAG